MISFEARGEFEGTQAWLKRMSSVNTMYASLERFGAAGVAALQAATPIEEGTTANSWYYEIIQDANSWSIVWGNTNIVDGRPIAVLLQYGHGTRTGGYVQGRDYINPALQPIFDQMTAEGWKVVTS